MAAFTSKAAGKWSATGQTTWTQVGVPGDGDTVTITHAVEVDVNTTIGASGAASSIAVLISGSGSLVVDTGVTFLARGDIQLANTVLTMAAGSTLTWDSSLAAGTPIYRLAFGNAGSQQSSKLVCNGTANSRVTMNKAVGSGNWVAIRFTNAGSAWTAYNCQYTDFLDMGSSVAAYGTDAIEIQLIQSALAEASFTNCTFTRVGRLLLNAIGAANNFVWQNNRLVSALGQWAFWLTNTAKTTGVRTITDNAFPSDAYTGGTAPPQIVFSGTASGITFERNVLAQAITSSIDTLPFASWQDNAVVMRSTTGTASLNTVGGNGDTLLNTYIMIDAPTGGNANATTSANFTGTLTNDGYVFETTAPDEDGDMGHMGAPTSLTATHRWVRCLCLPNSRGLASGSINSHGSAHVKVELEHNTIMTSDNTSPTTTGLSAFWIGSGYMGYPGMYPKYRDNLIWAPVVRSGSNGNFASGFRNSSPYTGTATGGTTTTLITNAALPGSTVLADSTAQLIVTAKRGSGPAVGEKVTVTNQTGTTLTVSPAFSAAPDSGTDFTINAFDIITTAGAGTNAFWNGGNGTLYNPALATTTKLGFDAFYFTTPATFGTTDIDLGSGTNATLNGPKFVDPTRNLATFDSAYLGNSATAWADATTYAVGDIRSAATSTWYGNATINYRCVTAHTSNAANSTNGKPGAAAVTGYRTNWEFASAYRIREAIIAGTTITDATLGLTNANYIKVLTTWIKKGFSPRQASLLTAASDGTTIGAQAGTSAGSAGRIARHAFKIGISIGI